MSFSAKLFINDEVRNVLNANQVFSRFADMGGRPTTKTVGSQLQCSIESTGDDSFFYDNMFSPTIKCKGEIVFYKRDGLSTLFKIEFANAQILSLSEHFDAKSNMPMYLNIAIGWGILKMKGALHQETWNPSNPFLEVEETVINNEEEVLVPKIVDQYWLDEDEQTKIEETQINKQSALYIKFKNIDEGEEITIVLEDADNDPSNNIHLSGTVNDKGEAILHQ